MDLFDVGFCLCRWKVNGALDAIEPETDHVLCGCEVTIPLSQFLEGDGFFPSDMGGDRRGRKKRVNTMNCSSPNGGEVGTVGRLCSGIALPHGRE